MSKYNWTSVTEYNILRYQTKNNFRFQINRPAEFVKTYQGQYSNMQPHESDPILAFDNCCQQTCPLLHNGRIYKCSTSGLLKDTLERFDYPNLSMWKNYLTNGLEPDCSDSELEEFIANFGKPNKICAQCPTKQDHKSTIDHYKHVSIRKI